MPDTRRGTEEQEKKSFEPSWRISLLVLTVIESLSLCLLHIGRLSLNTSALVQVHIVSGDELRTNLPNEFSSVV